MTAAPRRQQLNDIPGVRYVPEEHHGVGVLVLAGSRGAADEDRARILAEHGVIADTIQWFGGTGQQPGPWEVPIETFQDRVAALAAECTRVLICGVSFGAEAALLTATHSPTVDGVIAFAPSDVVWAGIAEDGRETSHWSIDGEPVPWVSFVPDWQATTDPPAFVDLYRASRAADPEAVAAAAIAAERIPALIQVVGGDDLVWPSELHAAAIADRRTRHGLPTTTVSVTEAGHRALLPGEEPVAGGVSMQRGGTDVANRQLGSAAWQAILPWLML